MAGHSHSANIAVRKGKQDAKRAVAFAKLSKNIMIAARKGPDPDSNFGLRHAIELARAQSMPKDNIEHAVKKGAGLLEGQKMTELIYEGYGSNGVAIICETLTDNINRTRPEVTKIFEQGGGKIGASGAVMWMFKRRGVIAVSTANIAEDKLMDIVLGAGADDMTTQGDVFEILTPPENFDAVRKALDAAKITTDMAELKFLADNETDVDVETAQKIFNLVEKLEDHDDVNAVHTSMKMTDEIVAAMR